jgi:hypothetical protein
VRRQRLSRLRSELTKSVLKIQKLPELKLRGLKLLVSSSESSTSRMLISLPVRRTLAEIEKSQADTIAKLKANEDALRSAHQRIKELEKKLQEEGNESTDLVELNQRLAEELEDEKTQHQKDLEEHDFANNQTRKKYQGKKSTFSLSAHVIHLCFFVQLI